jgi:hypothetical protein
VGLGACRVATFAATSAPVNVGLAVRVFPAGVTGQRLALKHPSQKFLERDDAASHKVFLFAVANGSAVSYRPTTHISAKTSGRVFYAKRSPAIA